LAYVPPTIYEQHLLIELYFDTLRFMTHVNDLHLLVMQDRFGII